MQEFMEDRGHSYELKKWIQNSGTIENSKSYRKEMKKFFIISARFYKN